MSNFVRRPVRRFADYQKAALDQCRQRGPIGLVLGSKVSFRLSGARSLQRHQQWQQAPRRSALIGGKSRQHPVGVPRQRPCNTASRFERRGRDQIACRVASIPELGEGELQQRQRPLSFRGRLHQRLHQIARLKLHAFCLSRSDDCFPNPVRSHRLEQIRSARNSAGDSREPSEADQEVRPERR